MMKLIIANAVAMLGTVEASTQSSALRERDRTLTL